MNIDDLLGPAEYKLEQAGVENYFMESRWLLAAVLKIHSSILYARPDLEITDKRQKQFRDWVAERCTGKPLAHIVGEAPFYELDFFVNADVLIPRPETEELVDLALERLDSKEKAHVLDLACGSGCIGLSLLHQKPDCNLYLSDASRAALDICQKNAQRHFKESTNYQIIESDFFKALEGLPRLDLIVCNPPYIHPDEKDSLDQSVLDFEPHAALFDPDPPALYARLLNEARAFLKPQASIVFELAPRWATTVLKQARKIYASAQIVKDLSNKERFLIATSSAQPF